ncbi:helix-turn-helix domain-containing protein [Streptomyces litchfieldiae]|uniref:Helix-turn-helix transcriptional regulator n=1 Tax=Streptomyces litchfieldiae TaxID=3075543 RepID=A0ABU2MLT6_9ACTN|nr:helix-turn-helix transcriptional regulator [Streptomyces sp. DSM 44938]MDT0342436.1 helix-turn-helix transcriptional regulator [Streptomyces sp. DSM 44938]
MTDGATGSTVPRRQLGRYLRELREKARLSVKAAAENLEWSTPKIWRIETGQVALRSLDVRNMCEIYGASPELTQALMGLAKETKAKGWWHAYGDVIPEGFDLYVGLEAAASSLTLYHGEIIPGLLQTEGFARDIIRTHIRGISEHELDGRVRLRIARQTILTRVTKPLNLRVVLSETVLRRPIGGAQVMANQLAHLVYLSGLPNIALRVVPLAAGAHEGVVTGPFNILRFPLNGDGTESEPPTIYADGYTGGLYLDKPKEVAQYDEAFRGIWEASLTEQASRRLIAEVAGSYEQG